ncbi:MAG: restriction endonuclease subunit S [bacterium]
MNSKGWRWVRLGEVCEINPPRPKNFIRSPDIPTTFIPMAAVDEETGTIAKPEIVPYQKVSKGYTYFEENVSFVGDNFPYANATINEHVFRMRGKTFLNQEFLFWFLYSPAGQSQIQQEFHGSAQGGINQRFVDGVSIPFPSVPEQHRIASYLKEKMRHIENLQSAIRNQQSALDALPQAILRKAFS